MMSKNTYPSPGLKFEGTFSTVLVRKRDRTGDKEKGIFFIERGRALFKRSFLLLGILLVDHFVNGVLCLLSLLEDLR